MHPQSAIVLFAHGARDPEWAEPFRKIQDRVAAERPGVAVLLSFLEFMPPSLPNAVEQAVDAGAHQITVVPLFMAQGGHLKHDVPHLMTELRHRHPTSTIRLAPAIGDVAEILEEIARWVCREHPR